MAHIKAENLPNVQKLCQKVPGVNGLNQLASNLLKTQYCPLSTACCNLFAAIFVMLEILRLLFAARVELKKQDTLLL